jgi:hypothetical protein
MVLAIAIVSLLVLPLLTASVFAFWLKHKAAAKRKSAMPSGHETPLSLSRLQEVRDQTERAQAVLADVLKDRPAAA